MKVLHVITGLQRGGAERQLYRLLTSNPLGSAVFSLRFPGPVAEDIRSLGVPVYTGGQGVSAVQWMPALLDTVCAHRPDVVCGWMYHGNLAACLACIGRDAPSMLWNVRHSIYDLRLEKLFTRWIIRAGAYLSNLPARIIYNSITAAAQHEELGYKSDSRVVIPNGFDISQLRPDLCSRRSVRAELGVNHDDLLVGVVGRSHPMKNHVGFIEAVALALPQVRFRTVIIGRGCSEGDLPRKIGQKGLRGLVQVLPETSVPERYYQAFDLLVMPSLWGEGFPNVVGEAMACGVPCLVTNIGDAAVVVGDTGFVAPAGEPKILSDLLVHVLSLNSSELQARGVQARERIMRHYSIGAVSCQYDTVFREIAKNV